MKKFTFALLVPLLGCDGAVDTATTRGSEMLPINNCGITQAEDNSEFWFSCGLSEENLAIVEDTSQFSFKEKQLCDVSFDDNNQPKQFRCKERPIEFDQYLEKGFSIQGEWTCSGLDGFGGYRSENLSRLSIHDNGTYNILLSSKAGTDSVWFVSDSVIAGTYTTDSINNIRLSPINWTSPVIDKTKLKLTDAPKFMMVKPVIMSIKSLSQDSFSASSQFDDEEGKRFLSNVACNTAKGI
jgi:hypothetical protein